MLWNSRPWVLVLMVASWSIFLLFFSQFLFKAGPKIWFSYTKEWKRIKRIIFMRKRLMQCMHAYGYITILIEILWAIVMQRNHACLCVSIEESQYDSRITKQSNFNKTCNFHEIWIILAWNQPYMPKSMILWNSMKVNEITLHI